MESFLKKIVEGRTDADCHNYFKRYGLGNYARRFILKLSKSKKLKINASFELANDFVKFINTQKELKYSGKIFSKEIIPGIKGRKKAGLFVYEVSESSLNQFGNAYSYLLNVTDPEIVLKVKKSLPKPGKNAEKIDDNFCSLELDLKYWSALKETFLWDVPECKKAVIEHTLKINEIILPPNEKDPAKMRELAKRKGIMIRAINIDGKISAKDYAFEV